MSRPLLILFAKAPVSGSVKTRLCPPLTHEEAADLHSAFVRDAAAMLDNFRDSADLELSTDFATDIWPDIAAPRSLQINGDLGQRMLHALELGLAAGHERVMILGSDSPGLPPAHVEALLGSQADLALGPTPDGGYFAIACRKINPGMFRSVRWSTKYTLADTTAGASACGLSVEHGPDWFDIDLVQDLRLMLKRNDVPAHTRAWLARHGGLLVNDDSNQAR